jgi:N-methylhydantoinase B
MRRAVRIKHRRGSVLDPVSPAPVGAATSVHHRFIDLCMEALSHFVPDRAAAHSGGSSGTLAISWQGQQAGARSLQYEVLGSAMGGMRHGDGASGVSVYCTNLAITPIEIIESQFPVRIRRFELVQDSAGAGTCRGGLSYRREYEALRPAGVIRRAERGRFPAAGVRGGQPGSTTRVSLDSGGQTRQLPVAGRYELEPGDVLRVEGPGGGGFGDPLGRPAGQVGRDVALGHVSAAAARRDYGVVCGPGGEVDAEATEVLRQQARAERTDDAAS